MSERIKKITSAGMMIALSLLMAALLRFPIIPGLDFLKYDPKDIVIALGGLIWGPVMAAAVTVCTSLLEMITVGTTGFWGLFMNIVSSLSFTLPVAIIYNRKKTKKRAIIGLLLGIVIMTAAMLAWNYLVAPIYMGVPRNVISGMLLSSFLPFNLVKSGINAVLTFLIYKPLITGLRKMGYVPISSFVKAKVIHGKGFGKEMGFPTANLELIDGSKLPPYGVYAANVVIDGQNYRGLANVGTRPTVEDTKEKTVELYVLDFDQDIYDKTIELLMFARIRGIKKFGNTDLLKKQLELDIETARKL